MAHSVHTYKTDYKILRMDYLFYFAAILLSASIFAYLILNFKENIQHERIEQIETSLLNIRSGEGQVLSDKIDGHKKKIDDLNNIISNRKIVSNVFAFIESKTIDNIWFYRFNFQGRDLEVSLSGQAQNMDALIKQVKVFEESKEYIKIVNAPNSEVDSDKKVNFTLNMILNPKVFSYMPEVLAI